MGVNHVWVVDPWILVGYIASSRGFDHPIGGIFEIPGTPIRLVLVDLFTELDEPHPQFATLQLATLQLATLRGNLPQSSSPNCG
jgi:hypothetical protein